MNIDFHYGVIYGVARLAGLSVADARTVAHACQYVDDATVSGPLIFSDGSSFERFASAHKPIDYRNVLDYEDARVWLPFHFVPAGEEDADCPQGDERCVFEARAVCRPDSAIARAGVEAALAWQGPGRLHRLGVALHAYVDTWAHQGFSGINSRRNHLTDLVSRNFRVTTIGRWFGEVVDRVAVGGQSVFVDVVSGLGHGAALHLPDMPWVKWSYSDHEGKTVPRDNLPDFMVAADRAHAAISAFREGRTGLSAGGGLPTEARDGLREFLRINTDHDEAKRLARLSKALRAGRIAGFGKVEEIPEYIAKGPGSWKHRATGIVDRIGDGLARPDRSPDFEASDYCHFHEAVKAHLRVMWTEILPRSGLSLPAGVVIP